MVRRNNRLGLAVATAAATVILIPAAARGQETVSVGLNARVISGTFGTDQTTRLVYVPAVVQAQARRFELSASFPYLHIGNGTVAPSQGGFVPMQGSLAGSPTAGLPMGSGMGGMMGQPASQPVAIPESAGGTPVALTTTNRSGLGDVVAGLGYRFVDNSLSGWQVVAGARLKLPTASAARGLGTGQADVAGTLTVRKTYAAGWLHAEGGYVRVGQPTGVDLRNVALWNAGAGRRLTERIYLLASAFGSGAVVPSFGAPAEVGAGVGIRLGEHLNLSIVPTFGLTDPSPPYAINFGLSSGLGR